MKKTVFILGGIVLVLGLLGIVGAGVAFAQGERPPMPMHGMLGGHGWMHDYVQQAFAAKLGLTVEEVQEQLASGNPMYQIALDNGIPQEELAAFMNDVHKQAFDQAVKDGVVTEDQADRMLERMQNRMQDGPGNCPMHRGQAARGRGMGPGMMNGSGMMGGQGLLNP